MLTRSLSLASALVVVAVPLLHTDVASGQQTAIDKQTCIAAAERGQELRDGRHIRDARGQFALCARSECPKSVATECARWRAEAEAALGAVKVEATDERGKPTTGVRVLVDGTPWTDDLSTPIVLDPGSHEVRFERAGSPPVVHTVTVAMGERDHVVRATFAAAPSPEHEPPPPPTPRPKEAEPKASGGLVLPLVFGTVGAVSLGVAGTFWLMGNADLDDARTRCSDGCAGSEADGAKTKHLVGDVALGVGVVAIAAAAYFLITREKAPLSTARF